MRRLAPWTFGVFLVHPLVLLAARRLPVEAPATSPSTVVQVVALTSGGVLGSLVVVLALSRVPLVRHAVT